MTDKPVTPAKRLAMQEARIIREATDHRKVFASNQEEKMFCLFLLEHIAELEKALEGLT